jgi:hypothetical protein
MSKTFLYDTCKRSSRSGTPEDKDKLRKILKTYQPGIPAGVLDYNDLIDNLCYRSCPAKTYIGAADIISDIDIVDNSIIYRGNKVMSAVSKKIGHGSFGDVSRIQFTVDGEPKYFAIKTSLSSKKLEEAQVIEQYTQVLNCPGIISMKVRPYRGTNVAIMPLADGDLKTYMGTFTGAQANNVVRILTGALLCMHKIGVYYFDIKPHNILFNCDGTGISSIYLGDMGSIIKIRGHNEWTSTYPPPPYYNGFIEDTRDGSLQMPFALKIYTYQLACLFCQLLVGGQTHAHPEPPTHGLYIDHYYSALGRLLLATEDKLAWARAEDQEYFIRHIEVLRTVMRDRHLHNIPDLNRCQEN